MFKTFWNELAVRVVCRVALIVAAVAVICGCDMDEGVVKYSSLPQEAKTFVETYFPGVGTGLCKWERDDGHKTYEVQLLDGTELEFDSSGKWIEVDCKFGTLPEGILPAAITEDLATRYPLSPAYKAARRTGGYEVSVYAQPPYGALDLYYTAAGAFVRALPDL